MCQVRLIFLVLFSLLQACAEGGKESIPVLPKGPDKVSKDLISTTGPVMIVTPKSKRTWINWKSYDVAKGHKVIYNQGSQNITVNTVTGKRMSEIAGTIEVKAGHSFLINRNGIVFKDGAYINGNMVFSTLPMKKDSFIKKGSIIFSADKEDGIGKISQTGTFKAKGLTAFVGPFQSLQGQILAPLEVYAAQKVAIHLSPDNLMGFDISGTLEKYKIDVASVTGKNIRITAGEARKAVDGCLNLTGHLKATGLREEKGKIIIHGENVTLANGSHLEAKGGEIRVGVPESYNKPADKNQAPLITHLNVEKGAKVDVSDAKTGGKIFMLAKEGAAYKGTFEARGKQVGGIIELSARKNPLWDPVVNLGGKKPGTIVLDPGTPVTIIGTGTPATNQITASFINTTLQTANVTIEAGGAAYPGTDCIVVDGGVTGGNKITWSSNAALSLIAPNITITGDIHYTGAADALGRLNLKADNTITRTGTITFNNGASYIRTFNTTGNLAIQGLTAGVDYTAYKLISTKAELVAINTDATTKSGSYALAGNIDISGGTWTPLGAAGAEFTGKLTGDNLKGGKYEIQGLQISSASGDQGLFGQTSGAVIDNVGVSVVSFTASGGSNHGLLIGRAANSIIFNTYSKGNILGNRHTGGLIGCLDTNSKLYFSQAYGNVTGGDKEAGGIAGRVTGNAEIHNCFAMGNITGGTGGTDFDTGGLVGELSGGSKIYKSFSLGDVVGSASNTGGLVGIVAGASSVIEDSFSLGTVTQLGGKKVGGLVGEVQTSGDVKRSYTVGNVSGINNARSFIGFRSSTVVPADNYSSNSVVESGLSVNNVLGGLAETVGKVILGDLFASTGSPITNLGAAYATGTSRTIIHMPTTALPIVPSADSYHKTFTVKLTAENQIISPVKIHNINHYFVPPKTAFSISALGSNTYTAASGISSAFEFKSEFFATYKHKPHMFAKLFNRLTHYNGRKRFTVKMLKTLKRKLGYAKGKKQSLLDEEEEVEDVSS